MRTFFRISSCAVLLATTALSQTSAAPTPARKTNPTAAHAGASPVAEACAPCIHAQESFLASDALRGRGSATRDEEIAANYIGAELMRYGIAPAGDNGGYVQVATITLRPVTGPPRLSFSVKN